MDKYVLITPAFNEEGYIEGTLKAVVAQTVLPEKWVIVDDGSTDDTGKIVRGYASKYEFIEYLFIEKKHKGDFASKVFAFNAGYDRLKGVEYDFIGNLDADITFSKEYFEKLVAKFDTDPVLGIGGGMVSELIGGKFRIPDYNDNSVAGAVQLFRRECFEVIGGYIPLKFGGVDAVVEIMSRMNNWKVKSFHDIVVKHHRRIGTSRENLVHSKLRYGMRDYSIGTHPLFMILKYINRIRKKPVFIGSLLTTIGYMSASLRNTPLDIPEEVFRYARKEQMRRILSALSIGRTKVDVQVKSKSAK